MSAGVKSCGTAFGVLLLVNSALCYSADNDSGNNNVLATESEIEVIDTFDFDENSFDNDLLSNSNSNDTPISFMQNFMDDFTFKIRHQLHAQVNDQGYLSDNGLRSKQDIENNRFNLLIKYQAPFSAGWLIQGNSQIKLFLPGDYEYGAHNDPGLAEFRVVNFIEFRINEIFIQKSFTDHSLKLGRQTIVWGEVQNNSVLDAINTREFRDLSVIDIEDARLNQSMLLWEYYKGNFRSSTFFNFYPEFNPQPRQGSPLSVSRPVSLNEPERNKFFYEVGSQLKWSLGASDISLMAAYLYENQLRFELAKTHSTTANAVTNDYFMIGAGINRAIGKLLIKLDLVYNHGVKADTLLANQVSSNLSKNQLGASFGTEYTISNEQFISASVAGRYFLDQSEDLTAGEQLINDDVFDRWRLLYSHTFFNKNLTISSLLIGSIKDKNLLASMALEYDLDDNWSVMGQFIYTWASMQSSTAVLDEGVRFGLNITYSF